MLSIDEPSQSSLFRKTSSRNLRCYFDRKMDGRKSYCV